VKKLWIATLLLGVGLWLIYPSSDPDIPQLEQKYAEKAFIFHEISRLGCEIWRTTNIRWQHFKKGESSEYSLLLYKELEPLLEEVGSDSIVIEGDTKCSLYLPVWGCGFAGDSNEMGFIFQPEQIFPFNPAIHLKENRDMKTDIRFTKALANGWFIDYKFD
jgi:hypothetical protein